MIRIMLKDAAKAAPWLLGMTAMVVLSTLITVGVMSIFDLPPKFVTPILMLVFLSILGLVIWVESAADRAERGADE